MTTTGADTDALLQLAREGEEEVRALDRHRARAEDACAALRRGSDPHRLHLDPGLLAEVDALGAAWRTLDTHLRDVAAALAASDALGALWLLLAAARARAGVARGVTADHLLDELRYAAAGPPELVAAWFDRLDPHELALLARDGGARLGRLDGAPLALRDAVNRRLVEEELARLRAVVAEDSWLERNLGIPLVRDGWRDAHQEALDRIAALEALLEARFVLLFDPSGDGRAVAAWGDPGTAAHVATVVPGISNHLGNVGDTLANAEHLHRAATDLRAGSVATIAWLGYDTPGSLGQDTPELVTEATHGGRAGDAAADLARFVDGLAAVRDGDPAHVTVIGHSYGSVVLGAALSDGAIALDEAVAVGSPGMGVDHVGEWTLPPGTAVWAESAGTPAPDWWLPGGGDDVVAHVPLHGRNPDDPVFGARGFDVTGARGHSSYFAVDEHGKPSMSLRSLAHITTGGTPAPDVDHSLFAPGPPPVVA